MPDPEMETYARMLSTISNRIRDRAETRDERNAEHLVSMYAAAKLITSAVNELRQVRRPD